MIRLARGALLFALVSYLANRIKLHEHFRAHDARPAIYTALRVGLSAVGLFAVCGFGVVRLALPAALRRHELLWVLPVGAALAALELTLLGFAFVPFEPSLALVIAGGVALAALALQRRGLPALPRPLGTTGWPLYFAALLATLALVPLWHAGFATVIGDGSDAHLAAGTAQFLQHHHPLAHAASEPVNKVPLVWRSKTPIYYALAATSTLSGKPTWQALAPMQAVLLAISLLGFFLAARELLGSNLLGAVAGMTLVGLDRMVLHTVMHPYYNQLWGFMTVAPALVLAWRAIADRGRAPTRGTIGLLALFLAIGTFAYPLALPIPAIGLVVFYWRARRERRARGEQPAPLLPPWLRPATPRARILTALLGLLLIVPVSGVTEKISTGFNVAIDPRQPLYTWAGDVGAYFPTHQFLSIESADLLWVAGPLLALGIALALWRASRPVAWGVCAVLALGAFGSFWFHQRSSGQYFDFKLLAYVGPIAVLAAAVGASRLPVIGWVGLAAFAVTAFHGADAELQATGNQLPKTIIAASEVTRLLGPGQSVRLDVNPSLQLWVAYFLHGEPLCSQRPLLGTSYPHVPVSRKARYILADHGTYRPYDAAGAPIAYVGQFRLYRERIDVPGSDRCSQTRVQTIKGVSG